jgi:hypothetical protein
VFISIPGMYGSSDLSDIQEDSIDPLTIECYKAIQNFIIVNKKCSTWKDQSRYVKSRAIYLHHNAISNCKEIILTLQNVNQVQNMIAQNRHI